MGFLSDLFGGTQARASRTAAQQQSDAAGRAIQEIRRTTESARQDLRPFTEVGQTDLEGLGALVTDPQAQADFIENNPFFEALATDAQNRILDNAAARGRIGSGGTAEALQNSLVLLGSDLLNRNIGQRMNLANLGQASAAGQANATLGLGRNVADLITGQGNAIAAGTIGAANARAAGARNVVDTTLQALGMGSGGDSTIGGDIATALMLSDVRTKEGIKRVGELDTGEGVYTYRYKGSDAPQIGVMAQEVEQTKPEAVRTIAGLKMVNLEAL